MDILEDIVSIVRDASVLADFKTAEISEKGGFSNIVTSADVAVQDFLCKKLSELLPQAGFYCEEENMKDTGKEYTWVIDPIDGTMNFSRNIADFCISVGLVHNGEPELGVVYVPPRDEMFKAQSGKGAFLNGKPIHVSGNTFDRALLCTATSTYRKELAKTCFDIIEDVFSDINDFRRFGTCAEELCFIACGKCDLYFEMRIQPWDYAGAYAILKEAGGYLCGLHGEKLGFDKPTVLIGANNRENLNKLSERVSKYIPKLPYTD